MSLPHLADLQFHQTRHHNSINLLLGETILFTGFPNVAEKNPRPLPLPATFAHTVPGGICCPTLLSSQLRCWVKYIHLLAWWPPMAT